MLLGLAGERGPWTAAGRLLSEPSAHQLLRLGSRAMRTRYLSCPVPPPPCWKRYSIFVSTSAFRHGWTW
ncbi:unnamed protein product [Musa textilis]